MADTVGGPRQTYVTPCLTVIAFGRFGAFMLLCTPLIFARCNLGNFMLFAGDLIKTACELKVQISQRSEACAAACSRSKQNEARHEEPRLLREGRLLMSDPLAPRERGESAVCGSPSAEPESDDAVSMEHVPASAAGREAGAHTKEFSLFCREAEEASASFSLSECEHGSGSRGLLPQPQPVTAAPAAGCASATTATSAQASGGLGGGGGGSGGLPAAAAAGCRAFAATARGGGGLLLQPGLTVLQGRAMPRGAAAQDPVGLRATRTVSIPVWTQRHLRLPPTLPASSFALGEARVPGTASVAHEPGDGGDVHRECDGVDMCRDGEAGRGEGEGGKEGEECRSGGGGGGGGESSPPLQVARPWGNFGLWYEGESVRGKHHGQGLLTNQQGKYDASGRWQVGKNGIWWKSCRGEWENDKMTGPAVITWLDGEVFTGPGGRMPAYVRACVKFCTCVGCMVGGQGA